jgi:pyruvyl transferase EpsO
MSQSAWFSCMESLKEQHKEIAELISGKSVAFVDIPTYFNVGDILICKGTEAFFKEYNIDVHYRCSSSYADVKKLKSVDVILLQGGGNFGDLYSVHQNFREMIITKFNDKTIICLPQSIYFESNSALDKSASLFRSHPDFYFFVRDFTSFQIAKKFTTNVFMMPDMAHSLHPLVDKIEVGPSNITPPRILNLIRVDKESNTKNGTLNKVGFDWVDMITAQDRFVQNIYYKMLKFPFLRSKAHDMWYLLSDELVFRSINYFSSHTLVHTDRLHGLILSALLGKEIYLKDNSYGKNTNYHKAWLNDYPYLELANEE